MYSVAEDLNRRGVLSPRDVELKRINKPLSGALWEPTQVKRVAITPTNAGLRSLNGTVVGQAQWEGLISDNDHHTLKQKLTDPSRKTWRDGSVKHLLVGIAECGVCGSPVRRVKNRGCPSYACWAGKGTGCVSRAQHFVDEYVTELVLGRLERPDWRAAFATGDDGKAAEAAAEKAALQARLDSFTDAAAAGDVSPASLAKIEATLLPQIADADRRARVDTGSPLVDWLAGEPDKVRERWEGLTVPQRRDAVRFVITRTHRIRLLRTRQGIQHLDPDSVEITPR